MQQKNILKPFITLLSLSLIVIAWCNQLYSWRLFDVAPSAFFTLSIFVTSVLLWLFVAIDWTSLLTLLLLSLVPELSLTKVFQSSFGHQTFIFLLLTFIVTYALNQTPFLKRITHKLLMNSLAQHSPFHFLVCFLSAVLFLSAFLSPTITFMFLFPLYEELMIQFGWQKGDKKASYILIAMFSTIALGTAMTPINHVFSVTAMSIYQEATQTHISSTQYMAMAIPTGLIIFCALLVSLKRLKLTYTGNITLQALDHLPKVSKQEKWIVSIFVMMIVLWIAPELLSQMKIDLALPPLLATIILSSVKVDGKPLVHLQKAISKGVHWQSLFLVGATLSLGSALSNAKVGVITLVEQVFSPIFNHISPLMLIACFIVWAGLQTNFTSNLVTVSFVTTLLTTVHVPHVHFAVLACLMGFMSSFAVMSAPAMPYVAISIGSEWTNTKDCLKYGGLLLLLTILAAILIAYPLGTLFM
ncbi:MULTISPECIES: SLC13 family permease [unclassified Granulicatella]|uniref:SLC13 family permease n=1 Tax=unclassified Granulicatella TaxID=2630493 RepID=UPI0010735991|nr:MULTISPECIES: SLC13 family permease [unclassified Granulicatella]MBF0780709.1 SLC13 family permease [Granulicatella sp. 19428wC4_WM01]TFU94202.1 SLC13 family permease [Granulicatella sp. WM01]